MTTFIFVAIGYVFMGVQHDTKVVSIVGPLRTDGLDFLNNRSFM